MIRLMAESGRRWFAGKLLRPVLAAAAIVLLLGTMAQAVEPDEVLDDPELEARARAISSEVRCLVCQNESIDSSNAELARDLRIIVRERLLAGDSDQQVYDYLVARYGDFVLLRPPVKPATYILWFGPAIAFLLGTGAVAWYFVRLRRRAAADAPSPLSRDEQERLRSLLADGEETGGLERRSSGTSEP